MATAIDAACAGLTDWHKYLNCFQLSGTQTAPLLVTHPTIPRRLHQEDATTFCFQHKFLEVCVCQPLLQSIFYWLIWYFVGWGGVGVGGFCFMHPFRWNLLVVILYFFIFGFSQMVEWLRYSACKLVRGNKRGNRKKQFSRYSSQKNTNSSRRILHTFQVHVLIWFVWPCQISFFGTRPTKHFITIICLRLSLLKKYAAFQFSRNNLKSNWKCVFLQGNPNLRYFYIMYKQCIHPPWREN